MKLSKRKIYFLSFAIGGVLLLIFIHLGANFSKQSGASLVKTTSLINTQPIYSFYKDDDLDGLSNAKEIIYGTDPHNPDTDKDGYDDGREVAYGYDPLKPGEARLKDRKNLNVTLKYFLWAQSKGDRDPQIRKDLLDRFFQAHPKLLEIHLVSLKDIKIENENDSSALKRYFSELAKVSLPEGATNYQTIAKNYNQSSKSLLEDLLSKVNLAYVDLQKIAVPPAAQNLQRDYLTVIRELYQMFQDLADYRKNPVQIELNLRKSKELLALSQQIEKEQESLREKYNLR